MPFSFFGFFMPQTGNCVQSAKDYAEKGKYKHAHRALDAAEKALNDARDQTIEEIRAQGREPGEF